MSQKKYGIGGDYVYCYQDKMIEVMYTVTQNTVHDIFSVCLFV